MNRESYMTLRNRNARAKELRSQGFCVRVECINNQLTHPQYIIDYPDKSVQADNGICNPYYKTHFKSIYSVCWE